MSQNYLIKLIYNHDTRRNGGDYLEIISFLASKNVGFDLISKRGKTRLEIGKRKFSYEQFKRDIDEIEKLIDEELRLQSERRVQHEE